MSDIEIRVIKKISNNPDEVSLHSYHRQGVPRPYQGNEEKKDNIEFDEYENKVRKSTHYNRRC